MDRVKLGKTGLEISRLGIGLSEIGSILTNEDEKTAAAVLNTALDNGINFLDTAACYGLSEDFVGGRFPTGETSTCWRPKPAISCPAARVRIGPTT